MFPWRSVKTMCHVSNTGWAMKNSLLFIYAGILFLGMLPLYAVEDAPFITDDEEYTVMAATLYHKSIHSAIKSMKDQTPRNDNSRHTQRLSGIPSNSFNLSRLTTQGSIFDKSLDAVMVDDFNGKNAHPRQIDTDKFAAATKGSSVTLVDRPRMGNGTSSIQSLIDGTKKVLECKFRGTYEKSAEDSYRTLCL
jgi:hypothetical protein